MVNIKRIIAASIIVLALILGIAIVVRGEVTRDRILYYDFSEGTGTVVNDKSGVEPLINLTIPDPTKVEWIDGGLRVKEATIVKSSGDLTKIKSNDLFSKGFTIEVRIKPANITQGGPARIVTFSKDSGIRNFTLGQSETYYQQRFRTSQTNDNGSDLAITTPANSIVDPPASQHVVYTRSPSGTATFYLDGVKVKEGEVPGDSSTWNMTCEFGLFNEMDYPINTRTWLGEIYSVAIYATVLTSIEVAENYSGSNTGSVTLAWDANVEPDLAGYQIYYGTTSRYDPAVAMTIPEVIEEACNLPDTGPLTSSQQSCKDSWEKFCTCESFQGNGTPTICTLEPDHVDYCKECGPCAIDEGDCDTDEECQDALVCPQVEGIDHCAMPPDGCKTRYDPPNPACDSDYFKYDKAVDVGNVTEYTLTGLPLGVKYYLAATAYDTDYPKPHHESRFSEELTHTFKAGITEVINLRQVPSTE